MDSQINQTVSTFIRGSIFNFWLLPLFIVPKHACVPQLTECDLQAHLCWAFECWSSGRFPSLDPGTGQPWADRERRAKAGLEIAGGHLPVITGIVADQDWSQCHFRWEQKWTGLDICHKCVARSDAGALNFCRNVAFPVRTTAEYLATDGARRSPLTRLQGFGLSMLKEEAMHLATLGCLRDATASALVEMCDRGTFGGTA